MFKLVGIIVIFMFIFKMGRKSDRFREKTDRVLKKGRDTIERTSERFESKVKYFYEVVTTEDGKKKKNIRAVEEIDGEEYRRLRDEVL